MKKFLIILLTLAMTLNFFSVGEAETLQEMIEAEQEAKQEKKQAKQIAKAARQANFKLVSQWAEEGDLQAQMILSYAYLRGLQVKKDLKISEAWRKKAAKENPVYVENFIPTEFYNKKLPLARLYGIAAYRSQVGIYVKPNYDDAVRWAQLGALEQDTWSLSFLGSAYYTGRGVQQDYKTAMDYFKKSKQEPLTLLLLSDAYAKGKGVEKDLTKSKLYADYLKLVRQAKIDETREKNLKKIQSKNKK